MENTTELSQVVASTRRSPTREALRHLLRHSSGRAGLIILGLWVFGPALAVVLILHYVLSNKPLPRDYPGKDSWWFD